MGTKDRGKAANGPGIRSAFHLVNTQAPPKIGVPQRYFRGAKDDDGGKND